MGKNKFGIYLDPCTWPYGHVFGGVDCNQVDKHFWFSGDPVNQIGWIDTTPSDHRNLLSTGPFNLKSNDPVDIIAAYVVGRGTDALNSITVTRGIVEGVLEEYKNNFSRLTYKSGLPTNPVVSYELYQNYPNPFNPTTTINFSIAEPSFVKLAVYNLLGEELKVLKNENMSAGTFNVSFDAESLPSGMYLYKIETAQYTSVRKMMLMK